MLLSYGLKSAAADKGAAQWLPGHQNLLLKILEIVNSREHSP